MTGSALFQRAAGAASLLWIVAGALPLLLAGCGEDTAAGCRSDDECRGARICVSGTCEEPDDPNNDPNAEPEPTPEPNPEPEPTPNNQPGCLTDIDCPGTSFCDPAIGLCVDGCRPGSCPDGQLCDFATRQCVGGGGCDVDQQCPDGSFCDEGACAEGCRDGGCGQGEFCDLDTRQCVDEPCGDDEACDDDAFCDEGRCLPGCRRGGCPEGQSCDLDSRVCVAVPCDGDEACDRGQICDEGLCQDGCREDGGCGRGEICDEGQCRSGCRADEACDGNAFCDEGQCRVGCREGGCRDSEVCDLDTRQCVERPCEDDASCGEGRICDEGQCQVGCRVDEACDDNAFCDEGQCRVGCREGGCAPGEVCELDTRQCALDLEEGPSLVVEPEALDFGEVGQNVSSFLNLVVRNVGDEDLIVNAVQLLQRPSTGFQVIAPAQGPIVIASLQSATWRVRFQPTFLQGGRPTTYGNTLAIDSNDPGGRVTVPMEGVGVPDPDVCLEFSDREVDFGFVAPGDVDAETISLNNCGNGPIVVNGLSLEGDAGEFSVVAGGFPRTIAPGADFNVIINYIPEGFAGAQASLIARAAGDVRAETILIADGAGCPEAEIQGRVDGGDNDFVDGAVRAALGDTIELTGEGSQDPADGDLIFAWSITAPDDSMSLDIDPDLTSEGLSFSPDATGTYEVRLSVTSALTGIEACEPAVFRVFVPEISIEVRWNDLSDVDLHLVRSDAEGEFSALGTGQNVNADDCYFGNRNPDWGVEGDTSDNPAYLVDDTNGFGPETILFSGLETGRSYQIAARMAQRRNLVATELTVRIFVGDDAPVEFTGEVNQQGAVFIPAILHGDGTIEATQPNP